MPQQAVTIVFERGELLWAVVAYCGLQFLVELALQLIKRRGQ